MALSTEALAAIRTTEGEFDHGGHKLFRRSAVPVGEAWARLAVVHGYGEHSGRYAHFFEWMAGRGIACHALDLRGQGRSSGIPGFVKQWPDYLDDVRGFLEQEALQGTAPLFVLGHSHGALVVAHSALKGLPNVRGYVLSAPYFRSKVRVPPVKVLAAHLLNPVCPSLRIPSGLDDRWMTSDETMRADSHADPLIVRTATPRWYCGAKLAQAEVMARAEQFRDPFLLLIGDADPVSDPDAAREFFRRATSPDKTEKVYPGLLHEILRESRRETVFTDIHAWLREHAG